MQNLIQKFRQSSIVFEKPSILSENLETLTTSNYPKIQYFSLKLRTRFLLLEFLEKSMQNFFLFCLDLELCKKIKHSFSTFLLITQI